MTPQLYKITQIMLKIYIEKKITQHDHYGISMLYCTALCNFNLHVHIKNSKQVYLLLRANKGTVIIIW